MEKTEEHRIDPLGDWKRTHHCGGLRAEDIGKEALLMGWVNSRRDMGNLIFIDLRDREGITQIVFDPRENEESHRRARVLRNEWVVAVQGAVSPRLAGQENPKLPTGAVEVKVKDLRILNRTETPPFQVDGAVDASETLRLKYRYLELRRKKVFENFRRRHLMTALVRDYLNRHGFIEVETPFLTKSTPEGARDYLVPSRVHKGLFYALPQSPQLFKQLLMISGFDRYYQIVRCFRDEDLRADRQPEFTQVDLEMSFADEEAVMALIEGLMAELFEKILGITLALPIARLEYREAMERFGTDRPDLRFGLEIRDVTELVRDSEFKVFRSAAESGGAVKALKVDGGGPLFSRKAWMSCPGSSRIGAPKAWPGPRSQKKGGSLPWTSSFRGHEEGSQHGAFCPAPGPDSLCRRSTSPCLLGSGHAQAGAGRKAEPDPQRSLCSRVDHPLSPP
jgi:aspartyl-tRNA synthetase